MTTTAAAALRHADCVAPATIIRGVERMRLDTLLYAAFLRETYAHGYYLVTEIHTVERRLLQQLSRRARAGS